MSTTQEETSFYQRCRHRTARILLSVRTHYLIIALVFLDVALALVDLSYSAIHPDCHAPGEKSHAPGWLEILSHISLAITCFFMVEIPLTLWSLGFHWYNPFGSVTHAWLHLFDAVVIIVTFILELVLRGQQAEAVALLIILRLWRIIKLVAGVTVGTGELEERALEECKKAKAELKTVQAELASSQELVSQLQKRLNAQAPRSSLDISPA